MRAIMKATVAVLALVSLAAPALADDVIQVTWRKAQVMSFGSGVGGIVIGFFRHGMDIGDLERFQRRRKLLKYIGGLREFPKNLRQQFDKGNRNMSFVHGGNSLQERVIPVLTVVHRAAPGGTTLEYKIKADQLDDVAGMYCIMVNVAVSAQDVLDFGGPKELDLALRAIDADDVQVELCQARGKARITGGAVRASVGERFELFFRLTGPQSTRVRLELHHPGAVAEVATCVLPDRFSVVGTRPPTKRPPPPETPSGETRKLVVDGASPRRMLGKSALCQLVLDDAAGAFDAVREAMRAHLARPHTHTLREWGYLGIPPRILVEPMLQGAGGMIVWPAEFLAGVRRLCDQYEIGRAHV